MKILFLLHVIVYLPQVFCKLIPVLLAENPNSRKVAIVYNFKFPAYNLFSLCFFLWLLYLSVLATKYLQIRNYELLEVWKCLTFYFLSVLQPLARNLEPWKLFRLTFLTSHKIVIVFIHQKLFFTFLVWVKQVHGKTNRLTLLFQQVLIRI